MSVKVVPVPLLFLALVLSPYSIIAGQVPCTDAIDIVQLQSIASLSDPNWLRKVENAIEIIKKIGPHANFGFATFGDKTIAGTDPKTKEINVLGTRSDYCLKVDLFLGPPDASKLVAPFQGFGKKAAASRGGDWANNAFGAAYRALLTSKMNWRPETYQGKKIRRLLVVVADSPSHLLGDVHKKTGKTVRPFDITGAGMKKKRHNENYDCAAVEYPSVMQLGGLLNELNAGIAVLVPTGGNYASNTRRYQGSDGLKLWYEDQLRHSKAKVFGVLSMGEDGGGYEEFYKELSGYNNPLRCG